MGNMQCPAEDAAHLAIIAQDICPFPNYNPNLLYLNLLSTNSSLHLKNHYTEVQSSLTEKQLDLFNQGLRTTFGREGRVTLGGVGVVALSLALFFDALSKQVKGQYVPEFGLFSDVFVKDPRGYYSPQVYTLSEYLRLVPYIANNPTRMREETERYLKLLVTDKQKAEYKKQRSEDVVGVNTMVVEYLQNSMKIHLLRITNSTVGDEELHRMRLNQDSLRHPFLRDNSTTNSIDPSQVSKTRKRRIPPPENMVTFNLNCDPEKASEEFLAEVQRSNASLKAYRKCQLFNGHIPKTWLHFTARLVWLDFVNSPIFDFRNDKDILAAYKQDFDLKSNALKEWAK